MNKKIFLGCIPLFFMIISCHAESGATPTIAEISKAVFSKCKIYDEKCVNEALAPLGCSLNNPLSQDPTNQDGVVNSSKQQCVKGVVASGVRILGEFEGEENFPRGSYGLRFEMGENITDNAIGFKQIRRRFAGLGEFLTGNNMVVDQIGPVLTVVPESVWKRNEFTFMEKFTLDKTSQADIEKAKKREGFGILPGGKARVKNFTFDDEGKLVEFSVSKDDEILSRILVKKIMNDFGKPTVSYLYTPTLDSKGKTEFKNILEASVISLKTKDQLHQEEADLLATTQKVLRQCQEVTGRFGIFSWNLPLVRITAPFLSIGCSQDPQQNVLYFGDVHDNAVTFTSPRYVSELRTKEEALKQGERAKRKQLRDEANSLF